MVVFDLMNSRQISICVIITTIIHRSDVKRMAEKKCCIMAVASGYISFFSITTDLWITFLQMIRDADSILT